MSDSKFSIIDIETADEWIYSAVVSEEITEELVEIVAFALKSVFSKEPLIREADINESIQWQLEMSKEYYDSGDITKEEYENWCLESSDRELVKQELIEAAGEVRLQDGLAASELLAAMLGSPTAAFGEILEFYGDVPDFYLETYDDSGEIIDLEDPDIDPNKEIQVEAVSTPGEQFAVTFEKFKEKHDTKAFIDLVPDALKVVAELKTKESIRSLGIHEKSDKAYWLDLLKELEINLCVYSKIRKNRSRKV